MSQAQYDNVTVLKKSNVFFDGKCISHTVLLADGSRKTLGVILPSTLQFTTKMPERMEIIAGECTVKVADSTEVEHYKAGQSFYVEGESSFEITVQNGILDYVCHFEG